MTMKFEVPAGVTAGIVIACLALGAGVTIHGLAGMDPSAWRPSAHVLRFVFLWAMVGTVLVVAARWRRLGALQVGGRHRRSARTPAHAGRNEVAPADDYRHRQQRGIHAGIIYRQECQQTDDGRVDRQPDQHAVDVGCIRCRRQPR